MRRLRRRDAPAPARAAHDARSERRPPGAGVILSDAESPARIFCAEAPRVGLSADEDTLLSPTTTRSGRRRSGTRPPGAARSPDRQILMRRLIAVGAGIADRHPAGARGAGLPRRAQERALRELQQRPHRARVGVAAAQQELLRPACREPGRNLTPLEFEAEIKTTAAQAEGFWTARRRASTLRASSARRRPTRARLRAAPRRARRDLERDRHRVRRRRARGGAATSPSRCRHCSPATSSTAARGPRSSSVLGQRASRRRRPRASFLPDAQLAVESTPSTRPWGR